MATKVIQWNEGTGNITLTYTGEGDGTIVVSSDNNNLSVARSQQITVKTTDGSKSQTVTISQAAYVRNYLKFTALESGTFTLTIPANVNATHLASVSYSLDNGATWVTTQNTSSVVTITTPTVEQGGTVFWKGSGNQTARDSSTNFYSNFSSTGRFGASGNIMSLLYGDNFENEKTITSSYCFCGLFQACSKIVTAPELPATTLANDCYNKMFYNCTSLTTAPELPATTLDEYCYYRMFEGCTSLTTVPAELPATTLSDYCYTYMFCKCSSIVVAPELSATILTQHCYEYMFNYCSSLVVAPNIHPTVVAPYCCNNMFWACTSLTTAPTTLPATTLADSCYRYMFDECRNLENTPELPALTLVSNCYLGMFHNCNKINRIKAMFTTTPSNTYTQNWVQGVASSGTFVKNVEATWDVRGNNGIPTNWTVMSYPFQHLKFTALESGTFSLVLPAAVNANLMTSISYSVDNGATWVTTINDNTDITITTPTIAAGDSVLWKGTGVRTANNPSANNFSNFSSTGSFAASGNIMSLLFENTFEDEKVLPNAYYTFLKLFSDCTGMTTPPELPATTLRNSCYNSMFYSCTSLTSMPELPATTLAESCYYSMFGRCSSLVNIQNELPATTLAKFCYQSMFYGCDSLQKAPDLPALTLVQGCYYQMFIGCRNITSLKCLATNISAGYCTNMWLYNVANSGTFIKNAEMSSWTRGANGIPEGWTAVNEIEYLESSTNEQFIDTGVSTLNSMVGIDCVVCLGYKRNDKWILGYNKYLNGNTGGFQIGIYNDNLSVSMYDSSFTKSVKYNTITYDASKWHHIIINCLDKSIRIDNTDCQDDSQIDDFGQNGGNVYLFTRNGNLDRTFSSKDHFKIASCKLYKDNNELVRDFVPVRVGDVGYMLDKVSGQLFGNGGSGSFIVGPDVVYSE